MIPKPKLKAALSYLEVKSKVLSNSLDAESNKEGVPSVLTVILENYNSDRSLYLYLGHIGFMMPPVYPIESSTRQLEM